MSIFFYKIFQNIKELYRGRNLFWQFVFIILSFISVTTGFDWFYYQITRGEVLQFILFPPVFVGFLMPIFLPIILFVYSKYKEH